MRRTVLIVTLAVLSVLLVSGSALARPSAAPALTATSSPETVRSYLRSVGIDPSGVVVQRGERNYAGTDCPGASWSCTTASKVLQLTSGGVNLSRCTTTGGSASVTKTSSGGNVGCVIVQSSTSGSNVAVCEQISVTGVPGSATQECTITQTSGSGANTARIDQTLVQGPICLPVALGPSAEQAQVAKQYATVRQSTTSGQGSANVDQDVQQCAARLTSSSVAQAQTTYQEFEIVQAPTGFDPDSPSCGGVSGSLQASASQEQKQIGYAPKATGGTQSQTADLIGHVDQCSSGVATYTVGQSEDQRLIAPTVVTQTQVGPFRCCSFQGVNPADTCTITQTGRQSANPNALQTESVSARAEGTTTCSSSASVTQNGVTNAASASSTPGNELVNEDLLTCTNGACKIETTATYTGPTTGDYTDTVTLSGTLTETAGGAPVAGKQVTLSLGTQSCTDETDAAGAASCPITITQVPSVVQAGIAFAEDATHKGSSASAAFTITTEEVSLTYTGPTYGKKGKQVTVSAKLRHDGAGLVGETLTFKLGTGSGAPTCTAVTSGSYGYAACTLTLPYTTGTKTLTVSFAGDELWDPASTSVTFTIKSW
jgi:hypothetical protein